MRLRPRIRMLGQGVWPFMRSCHACATTCTENRKYGQIAEQDNNRKTGIKSQTSKVVSRKSIIENQIKQPSQCISGNVCRNGNMDK